MSLHDLLNAGIALFESAKNNSREKWDQLQKGFEELKERGAAIDTPGANRVRSLMDRSLEQIQLLKEKADEHGLKKMEDLYRSLEEELRTKGPEGLYERFKSRLDDLTKSTSTSPSETSDVQDAEYSEGKPPSSSDSGEKSDPPGSP